MGGGIPRYKGICPVCGAVLWIQPSIAMSEGWHNGGHGSCFQCKTFLHLVFNPDEKEFEAEEFSKYAKRTAMEDKT